MGAELAKYKVNNLAQVDAELEAEWLSVGELKSSVANDLLKLYRFITDNAPDAFNTDRLSDAYQACITILADQKDNLLLIANYETGILGEIGNKSTEIITAVDGIADAISGEVLNADGSIQIEGVTIAALLETLNTNADNTFEAHTVMYQMLVHAQARLIEINKAIVDEDVANKIKDFDDLSGFDGTHEYFALSKEAWGVIVPDNSGNAGGIP